MGDIVEIAVPNEKRRYLIESYRGHAQLGWIVAHLPIELAMMTGDAFRFFYVMNDDFEEGQLRITPIPDFSPNPEAVLCMEWRASNGPEMIDNVLGDGYAAGRTLMMVREPAISAAWGLIDKIKEWVSCTPVSLDEPVAEAMEQLEAALREVQGG